MLSSWFFGSVARPSWRWCTCAAPILLFASLRGPAALASQVVWTASGPARPDVDELVPEEIDPIETRFAIDLAVISQAENADPTVYFGYVYTSELEGKRLVRNLLRASPLGMDIPGYFTIDARRVPIFVAQPLGEALTEVFARLFPAGRQAGRRRGSTTPSYPPRQAHRLEATYAFSLEVLNDPGVGPGGLRAELSLKLFEPGQAITVLAGCSGESRRIRNIWTQALLIESFAEDAFRLAIGRCVEALRGSPDLRRLLEAVERQSTAAADLRTEIAFDDTASLLPNGRLDAGDTALIRVKVRNEGPGKAFGLSLHLSVGEASLVVPPITELGDLAVGSDLTREVEIQGTLALPSRSLILRAEVVESRGFAARPVDLEITAASLTPPQLEIFDVSLNDGSPPAAGDGDGLPGAGETVEAIVRVRNNGGGAARAVQVGLVDAPQSIRVLAVPAPISSLAIHEASEVRLLFALSRTFLQPQLELLFSAVDGRGKEAASASQLAVWRATAKRPDLRLDLRLADGGSQGSRGNRDGIANSGETLELSLTLTNRGSMSAENVEIDVLSGVETLVPTPRVVDFGSLAAGATSRSQWVALALPRTFSVASGISQLPLRTRIRQEGFQDLVADFPLPFKAARPTLQVTSAEVFELERGTSAELSFELHNRGELAAEEVQVTLESTTPGLELLDEAEVPRTTRVIEVGAVPPAAFRRVRTRVSARSGATAGEGAVSIAVTQKDFAGPRATAAVRVLEQAPIRIAAGPVVPDPRPRNTAPRDASPPTISFLRYQAGEKVAQEAIVLRFEVQHAAALEDVRLEVNDLPLPVSSAPVRTTPAGTWTSSVYELPVQLARGENRFVVTAITADGQRGARPISIYRDEQPGRVWVVAIGVSSYQDSTVRSLQYAHRDAEAVAAYFREALELPEEQVFLRTNERASLREVRSLLATVLPQRATRAEDTVILYLAGHGLPEPVLGGMDPDGLAKYFLTSDASPADLYSTALPMGELEQILRRYRAERVVVILDSCFSGASASGGRTFFDRERSLRTSLTTEFLSRLAEAGKGRAILAASEPNEVALENSQLRHGLFTYHLLAGLRGEADSSADGVIDLDELYRYVSAKVEAASGGAQRPMRSYPALLGQILIGRALSRTAIVD